MFSLFLVQLNLNLSFAVPGICWVDFVPGRSCECFHLQTVWVKVMITGDYLKTAIAIARSILPELFHPILLTSNRFYCTMFFPAFPMVFPRVLVLTHHFFLRSKLTAQARGHPPRSRHVGRCRAELRGLRGDIIMGCYPTKDTVRFEDMVVYFIFDKHTFLDTYLLIYSLILKQEQI